MQMITPSIIYRDPSVYTALYRASNMDDKSSEWGDLNNRVFMVRWQTDEMNFFFLQATEEGNEKTSNLACEESEWNSLTWSMEHPENL